MIQRYIKSLKSDRELGPDVVHHQSIPERLPEFSPIPAGIDPRLVSALAGQGIDLLWSHQAQAIAAVRRGEHVVVVTPTASGKTLCYNVPVIQAGLEDPDARALYLFPIKALEQDQLMGLRELIMAAGLSGSLTAEVYDGDTPSHKRSKIRENPPTVIMTNPDMVHVGLLPYHEKWEKFFKSLKFLVIDELHTYKGVFGMHIAQVMRRLLRIAAFYGSEPLIVSCSATISNPADLAQRLTGRSFTVVDKNGAPAAARHFLFVNPIALSASTAAARLFRKAVDSDLRTIVFTKARRTTELIYTWISQSQPRLRPLISAYRAGYLPEERREIEAKLFSGELKGVISTSALEMGIDIGGLDVCILVGYPGTITATWQRGGRVGRQDRESLIVMVAQQDALDLFFMKHPEVFFHSGYERAVVDPYNRPILKEHLVCAAAEMPLILDDAEFDVKSAINILTELETEGKLLKSRDEPVWHSNRRFPQREISIRSLGESYTIFEDPERPLGPKEKPRVIGSLDGMRAFKEGHPGAIYLHRANQYQMTRMQLEKRNIFARNVNVNYYTMPRLEKETEILGTRRSRPVQNFIVQLGDLKVTERVIGYEKKRISGQERLSIHELDLPPLTFETVGLWIEIEDYIQTEVKRRAMNFMGGIHAVEHAAISLFPLFAMCDRDDVGGISTPMHEQVQKAAIFIYDGVPGGVGLSEQCFEVIDELLRRTLELIETCTCETGCPACVHSPKCGSGNVPLDKDAAILVLKLLLGLETPKAIDTQVSDDGPPIEPEEEPEEQEPEKDKEPRILYFDLETVKSPDEVGGWKNIHLMHMALGVVFDSESKEFTAYLEKDVDKLIDNLFSADLVIGFNLLRFDYTVLSAYSTRDFRKLPTFDMLVDIYRILGFRLGLGHLCECTLGVSKSADGVQSLEWVRQGRMDLVEKYCQKDVELTRDLFLYGCEHGNLCFKNRDNTIKNLRVDWNVKKIMDQIKGL